MRSKTIYLLALLLGLALSCSNFDNINACQGQQTDNPSDWAGRVFQTPPPSDPDYRSTYQSYHLVQGWASTVYSTDRTQAVVTFNTKLNPRTLSDPSSYTLKFTFDGIEQDSNIYRVSKPNQEVTASCTVYDKSGNVLGSLQIEPIDFIWNHPAVQQPSSYQNGQKGGIIEMFGWSYEEIEKECVDIGKNGWLGVKVFPPSEAILDFEHPEQGEMNPWFWFYQPVSYRLTSRQGTREQLQKMINTCRSNNVRVYADAVVNHMSGNGNDMLPTHCSGDTYWGNKNSSNGSPFYTQGYAYTQVNTTGLPPGTEFPAAPYGPLDFHCARALNSWTDPFILNYGWLVNLCDLNTEKDNVRQRIADYFTALLGIGFSGFRVDAAKHISPDNLAAILAKFKFSLGGSDLPADFITYLEVIIGGEKDLLMCQQNSYNYGQYFHDTMGRAGLSESDINKVKIWSSDYPKEFPICGYWTIPSERLAIQNDCHDDQFPGSSSRDMGDKGSVLVKDRDLNRHRGFEVQMFTRTDGNWQIRLLLTSYTFRDQAGAYGPPDGLSDCARCLTDACKQSCTKSMPYAPAHDPNACGYTSWVNGQWQQGAWTRTHRDPQIILAMRQWMGLSTPSNPEDIGIRQSCWNSRLQGFLE